MVSQTITGLVPGSSYDFEVSATNVVSTGPFSTPLIGVVTASSQVAPSAPQNPAAGTITTTSVQVTWTTPATGTPPLNYTLQWRLAGGGAFSSNPTTTLNNDTVTGLIPSTAYEFQVLAANTAGTSGPSAIVPISTVAVVINPPSAPTITGFTATGTTAVTLVWTAPISGTPPLTYQPQWSPHGLNTWTNGPAVQTLSAQITGLTANTSYDYRLTATNANGTSAQSAIATSSTLATLPVTAWNPQGATQTITFSNSNLTATMGGPSTPGVTPQGMLSTTSRTTGKWWFQVTINSNLTRNSAVGLANANATIGEGAGDTINSCGFYPSTGAGSQAALSFFSGGAQTLFPIPPASGDVVSATITGLVDMDAVGGPQAWFQTPNMVATYGANTWNDSPTLAVPAVVWGAAGHINQGGPYTAISIQQQAVDLKNVFGSGHLVVYRAVEAMTAAQEAASVASLQAQGIEPIVNVMTFPAFASYADQTAAYNAAYADVATRVQAMPTVKFWEIGNEWTINPPTNVYTNNGELASDWTGQTYYTRMVGVVAGATAAIRDNSPNAKVIGGATAGWKWIGLAPALAQGLTNYAGTGRNLMWDYTCLHWYNDVPGGGNTMGSDLANFSDENLNAYALLKPAGRPLFITEFGSSNLNNSANNAQAATNLTALMDNFALHQPTTATEPGVYGALVYQFYQEPQLPQNDYFLYTYTSGPNGAIAAQGTAVRSWIISNPGNLLNAVDPGNGVGGLHIGVGGALSIYGDTGEGGDVMVLNAGSSGIAGGVLVPSNFSPWGGGITLGTAPGQVTGLTAQPVSSSQVNLSWSAPSGTPPFTYLVQYRVFGTTLFASFALAQVGPAASVTGLQGSTIYEFRVTANNPDGTGAASSLAQATTAAGSGPVEIFLTTTGAGTWTVPANWNNSSNLVECVGGGVGSVGGSSFYGGAGGAYSARTNISLAPGAVVNYAVGAGSAGTFDANPAAGGDTWFNGTALSLSSVGAKGGSPPVIGSGTISTGGLASAGIGVTKFSGGNGAKFSVPGVLGGGGGGGAGGAGGDGGAGGPGANNSTTSLVAGGGGGAGSGGSAGSSTSSNVGGAGGNPNGGAGGAASSPGGDGSSGGGGGGGGGGASFGNSQNGGAGGAAAPHTLAGGGGGGAGGSNDGGFGYQGGAGGTGGDYGGGAGGSGPGTPGVRGANGGIRITYTPTS